MPKRTFPSSHAFLLVTVLAGACQDAPRMTTAPLAAPPKPALDIAIPGAVQPGVMQICKSTPPGTTGTFQIDGFLLDANDVIQAGQGTFVDDGQCKPMFINAPYPLGEVQENLVNGTPGFHLASVLKYTLTSAGTTITYLSGNYVGTSANPVECSIDYTIGNGCTVMFVDVPNVATPNACPGPVATLLGRAGPSNYSMLAVGGGSTSQLSFSGGVVQGNAGVASPGRYAQSGATILTGTVYLQSGATASTGSLSILQGGTIANRGALVAQAASDALNATSALAAMAPTLAVPGGAINLGGGATSTITGAAGMNVVNLTTLKLSGGSSLVLSAPAGAQFVINVSGILNLSGSSQISVSGGIGPYDVIFNYGGAQQVSFSGGSMVTGLVLAPSADITASGSFLTGEVIGASNGHSIAVSGGSVIYHPPVCP